MASPATNGHPSKSVESVKVSCKLCTLCYVLYIMYKCSQQQNGQLLALLIEKNFPPRANKTPSEIITQKIHVETTHYTPSKSSQFHKYFGKDSARCIGQCCVWECANSPGLQLLARRVA